MSPVAVCVHGRMGKRSAFLVLCAAASVTCANLDITGSPAKVRFIDEHETAYAEIEGAEGWLNSTVVVAAPNFVTAGGADVNALKAVIRDLQEVVFAQHAAFTTRLNALEAQVSSLQTVTAALTPPFAPPPPLPPSPFAPGPPPTPVTCRFTVDNVVRAVYFDGVDITGSVSGSLVEWGRLKTVSFVAPAHRTAVLAIVGEESGASCSGGFQVCAGFLLACTSTDAFWGSVVSRTTSGWRAYKGTPAAGWQASDYDDSQWDMPITSTSGFTCEGCGKSSAGGTPEKIWLDARRVTFRLASPTS